MEQPILGGFVASATSTAAAGPLVRTWLHRRASLDHPNERSSHVVPTPRGGGLACAAGALIGAAASRSLGVGPSVAWVGSIAVLGAVGRADDVMGLSPLPRLSAQILTGTIVGARKGGLYGAISGSVTVPALVNAFNFMDGINGISGGTAVAWGLITASDRKLASRVRAQSAITAGVGLGFLPYNIPSASMFLGDVGSYLLGAGIAATVLESAFVEGRPDLRGASRTIVPLALYLADTGSTIARRVFRGQTLTEAHREHAYQRLVQETGWPHWVVSGFVAGATAACGLASRSRHGTVAIPTIVVLYLASPSLARLWGSRSDSRDQTVLGEGS